jgi:hypothetical protein
MVEPESQQDGLEPSLRSFAWDVFVNGGTLAVRVVHWWGLTVLAVLLVSGVAISLSLSVLPLWAVILVLAVLFDVFVVIGAHRTTVKAITDAKEKIEASAGFDREQQERERRELDEDLRALAPELNDFLIERHAGIKQVSGDQASRYEMDTWQIYVQRFQARAFQMCERLHERGWITDKHWEHLLGFDIPVTLPGERVVDVARRFGVAELPRDQGG